MDLEPFGDFFSAVWRGLKFNPFADDKQMVLHVFAKNGLRIAGVFLTGLMLAGCGSGDFDAQAVLESRPVKLDGEQVVLNPDQVDCGVREDLWTISPLGEGRSVGRLTQKGRDLQFSDDVQVGDPGVGAPHTQVRGSLSVQVFQVGSVRDEDAFTKQGDAKVGVKFNHSCFQANPPLLMGIRHGQFDPSANPVFRFKKDQDWQADQVIH